MCLFDRLALKNVRTVIEARFLSALSNLWKSPSSFDSCKSLFLYDQCVDDELFDTINQKLSDLIGSLHRKLQDEDSEKSDRWYRQVATWFLNVAELISQTRLEVLPNSKNEWEVIKKSLIANGSFPGLRVSNLYNDFGLTVSNGIDFVFDHGGNPCNEFEYSRYSHNCMEETYTKDTCKESIRNMIQVSTALLVGKPKGSMIVQELLFENSELELSGRHHVGFLLSLVFENESGQLDVSHYVQTGIKEDGSYDTTMVNNACDLNKQLIKKVINPKSRMESLHKSTEDLMKSTDMRLAKLKRHLSLSERNEGAYFENEGVATFSGLNGY